MVNKVAAANIKENNQPIEHIFSPGETLKEKMLIWEKSKVASKSASASTVTTSTDSTGHGLDPSLAHKLDC